MKTLCSLCFLLFLTLSARAQFSVTIEVSADLAIALTNVVDKINAEGVESQGTNYVAVSPVQYLGSRIADILRDYKRQDDERRVKAADFTKIVPKLSEPDKAAIAAIVAKYDETKPEPEPVKEGEEVQPAEELKP